MIFYALVFWQLRNGGMVGPNTVAINLTLHCTVGEQGPTKHGGKTNVNWWILDTIRPS